MSRGAKNRDFRPLCKGSQWSDSGPKNVHFINISTRGRRIDYWRHILIYEYFTFSKIANRVLLCLNRYFHPPLRHITNCGESSDLNYVLPEWPIDHRLAWSVRQIWTAAVLTSTTHSKSDCEEKKNYKEWLIKKNRIIRSRDNCFTKSKRRNCTNW